MDLHLIDFRLSADFDLLTLDHLSVFEDTDVTGRVVRVDVSPVVRREGVEVDGILVLDDPEEEASTYQELPDGAILYPVLEDPHRGEFVVG